MSERLSWNERETMVAEKFRNVLAKRMLLHPEDDLETEKYYIVKSIEFAEEYLVDKEV